MMRNKMEDDWIGSILPLYLSASKNFDFKEKKIKTKIISVKSKI